MCALTALVLLHTSGAFVIAEETAATVTDLSAVHDAADAAPRQLATSASASVTRVSIASRAAIPPHVPRVGHRPDVLHIHTQSPCARFFADTQPRGDAVPLQHEAAQGKGDRDASLFWTSCCLAAPVISPTVRAILMLCSVTCASVSLQGATKSASLTISPSMSASHVRQFRLWLLLPGLPPLSRVNAACPLTLPRHRC